MALSQRLGVETVGYAATAANLGFEGVFVFDHLVPLADPSAPALEATVALGALAGTVSIRVGSLVLRATLRPPAVTAAIAASVAAISRHPPVIGVGAGDSLSRPETERFGLPFPSLHERLAILASTVEAVRATGVTAWVGGLHPAVIAIAHTADGWNLWEPGSDRLQALVARRPSTRGYTLSWGGRVAVGEPVPGVWLSGSTDTVAANLRILEAAGFDEVVLAPLPSTDRTALDRIAEVRSRL